MLTVTMLTLAMQAISGQAAKGAADDGGVHGPGWFGGYHGVRVVAALAFEPGGFHGNRATDGAVPEGLHGVRQASTADADGGDDGWHGNPMADDGYHGIRSILAAHAAKCWGSHGGGPPMDGGYHGTRSIAASSDQGWHHY